MDQAREALPKLHVRSPAEQHPCAGVPRQQDTPNERGGAEELPGIRLPTGLNIMSQFHSILSCCRFERLQNPFPLLLGQFQHRRAVDSSSGRGFPVWCWFFIWMEIPDP